MEFVAGPNVSRHAKIITPVHSSRDAPPLPAALSSFSKGQQLGKGAFGTVYLAIHKPTGNECVMKEVALRGLDPSKLESACGDTGGIGCLQQQRAGGHQLINAPLRRWANPRVGSSPPIQHGGIKLLDALRETAQVERTLLKFGGRGS